MPDIPPLENEIEIPEITPELPPEIEPKLPPPPEEVSFTAMVLKEKIKQEANFYLQWKDSPYAWLVIPVGMAIIELNFFTMQIITTALDAIINTMLQAAYDITVAFKSFVDSVNEHYKGNWAQAIIDLTIRVILLEALDYAMNIPAIKQTVDLIIDTTKKIRRAFSDLRGAINAAFAETFRNLSEYFKENNEILVYFFRQELDFWTNSINKFIGDVQNKLIARINNLEQKYLSDIYRIGDELENLKKTLEKYEREFKHKVTTVVDGLYADIFKIEYVELGPREIYEWLKARWRTLQDRARGFVDRILQLYDEHTTFTELDLSVFYREMMLELLDRNSEMNRHIEEIVKEVNELDKWLKEGNTVKMVIKDNDIVEVRERRR